MEEISIKTSSLASRRPIKGDGGPVVLKWSQYWQHWLFSKDVLLLLPCPTITIITKILRSSRYRNLDNLSKDMLLLLAPPFLATGAVLDQHIPRLGAHCAVSQLAERGQLWPFVVDKVHLFCLRMFYIVWFGQNLAERGQLWPFVADKSTFCLFEDVWYCVTRAKPRCGPARLKGATITIVHFIWFVFRPSA